MCDKKRCINCNRPLLKQNGLWLCPFCNSRDIDAARIFIDEKETDEYVFIECPGATLYEPGTNNVIAGVEVYDHDDPSKGHRIIDHPVYAPNHRHRRRIKREALGRITRCRACQDYTVRMRRKEGPDFFIPSPKHPRRTKLKEVKYVTYEP